MPSRPHGRELDPVRIGFLIDMDVGVKDNFVQPFELAFEEAYEEAFAQSLVGNGEDVKEGIRAFMERREPSFKGR